MSNGRIDFTFSIALSGIGIIGACTFILFLTWGKTRKELKKRKFAILIQILIIASHAFAMAGLIDCMNSQDLGFGNIGAWTLLDIPSLIDTLIGLMLMLVDLKILTLMVKVLDDPVAEGRVNTLKKIAPPVYLITSLPFMTYEITWSFIGTPSPLFASISAYLSIFAILWLVIYEALQSIFIFHLIFKGRILSGQSTKVKERKIGQVAVLIFASLFADLLGAFIYVCGRESSNLETSTIFYHLAWCCTGYVLYSPPFFNLPLLQIIVFTPSEFN